MKGKLMNNTTESFDPLKDLEVKKYLFSENHSDVEYNRFTTDAMTEDNEDFAPIIKL